LDGHHLAARIFGDKIHFHQGRLAVARNLVIAKKVNLQISSMKDRLGQGFDERSDMVGRRFKQRRGATEYSIQGNKVRQGDFCRMPGTSAFGHRVAAKLSDQERVGEVMNVVAQQWLTGGKPLRIGEFRESILGDFLPGGASNLDIKPAKKSRIA